MLRHFALALSLLICPWLSGQVFRTGKAMLGSPTPMYLMTPAQYQRLANAASGRVNFRAIDKMPPALSSDYRVGVNFIYDGVNHSWILDFDSKGYRIIPDLKGNGDLSRAQSFRFHGQGSKKLLDLPVKDDDGQRIVRFELQAAASAGQWPTVLYREAAVRAGTAVLDGMRVPFRLVGSAGKYDDRGDTVQFDRGNNGHFENYDPKEGSMNVAGKTYEFQVDSKGASLSIRAVAYRPDRPTLTKNSRIPQATLTDLDGKPRALDNPDADVTLLEFWDTHCGPCREEMPKLQSLYAKYPRDRFTIVGISDDESREELTKYLSQLKITWPECLERDDGPVHRLFRIEGMPTYFLVRRDGTILDHWFGSDLAVKKVEAALQ